MRMGRPICVWDLWLIIRGLCTGIPVTTIPTEVFQPMFNAHLAVNSSSSSGETHKCLFFMYYVSLQKYSTTVVVTILQAHLGFRLGYKAFLLRIVEHHFLCTSTPLLILQYQQSYANGRITVCGFRKNLTSKTTLVDAQNIMDSGKPIITQIKIGL